MDSNQVKYFRQFFELDNLSSLNLSNNLIEKVEDAGKVLEYLETLDLSHNRLESLQHFSRYFPSVFALDLDDNEIVSCYELKHLSRMSSLIDLSLQDNSCISSS